MAEEEKSWVESQSGVAAPERAKSYSERVAESSARAAEYFSVPYVNGRVRENDYSVIPSGGGGGSLPFQVSGSGDSWSVSGGRVNNVAVEGASFVGRNLSLYIDVEDKSIVASKNDLSHHYIPLGAVENGVGASYLTSNILTSSVSGGCQFFYWGI